MKIDYTSGSFTAEAYAQMELQRHACEVRYLARMDTHAQRGVYLEGTGGVRDRRGDAAADRLRRDVWEALKQAERPVEPLQEALFA